jgi:hypothetical protein
MEAGKISFISFSTYEVEGFHLAITSLEQNTPNSLTITAYHNTLLFPVHYFPGSTTLVSQCGAYNQDGSLISSTVISRGARELRTIPEVIDSDAVCVAKEVDIAVYGGFMTSHFGHALLETTARLWALIDQVETADLLFCGSKQVSHLARQLIELCTPEASTNIIVPKEPIRVKTLLVPTPSLVIKKYIHKNHCEKLRDNIQRTLITEKDCPLLYLSRSRLTKDPRAIQNEDLIEKEVRSRNGLIYHPQEHSLFEQLSITVCSSIIIAPIGSAVHILLASSRPKTVIYLCGDEVNLNYLMIDKLMGNRAIYVRCLDAIAGSGNDKMPAKLVCNLSLVSEVFSSLLS